MLSFGKEIFLQSNSFPPVFNQEIIFIANLVT